MSRTKTIATATEADWTFMGDGLAVKALEGAAHRAAREFEAVKYEDAFQDAVLWLAVRPEVYDRARASGDYARLYQDVYAHGLREPAIGDSERRKCLTTLPEWGEG